GSAFLNVSCSFEDSACLHLRNLGVNNPKPATSMSKHRIEFVQFIHPSSNNFDCHAQFFCQLVLLGVVVREEFVQRRVEKTDRCRQTVQCFENPDKILPLIRKQSCQSARPI